MAARVVIEVDGSQHGEGANIARDEERTRWFEAEGYRVIRFWNNDIVGNIYGVLDTVYAAVYGSREAEPLYLKRERRRKTTSVGPTSDHPTPARPARRPSPSKGG